MRRFVLEADRVFLNQRNIEEPPEPFEVQVDDVYNIDIILSTGEGRMHEEDDRPSGIYVFTMCTYV